MDTLDVLWHDRVKPITDKLYLAGKIDGAQVVYDKAAAEALSILIEAMARRLDLFERRERAKKARREHLRWMLSCLKPW